MKITDLITQSSEDNLVSLDKETMIMFCYLMSLEIQLTLEGKPLYN